ncbi:MAG: hypothetical protein ACFFAN_04780 [Promethearchaeota archaeon]
MIVIFLDDIQDFAAALPKRIMNEIFYEFKEINTSDLSSKVDIEIILHFLSKVEEYICLYETKVNLTKDDSGKLNSGQHVINELQKIFSQVDSSLSLVKGKIREIFLSFSS